MMAQESCFLLREGVGALTQSSIWFGSTLKWHKRHARHWRTTGGQARFASRPSVLRHTTAMELLQSGVDRTLIALWLGHESVETTQIYLDAKLAIKEEILAKTTPINAKAGRYRPDDNLLAFLKGL
jgi:site-specific recombinase XerD